MRVIVLGAGTIGVASAWFLRQNGHDVTVIDRRPGAGQETSFANGGQISVCNAEPWANPSTLAKIIKWLGQADAPLLYRFRMEWLQWKWSVHFLRECTAARANRHIRQIVALCEYSRQVLQAVRAETQIQYDLLTRGILHFYTEQKAFDLSLALAKLLRELGCPREPISAEEVIKIEPALAAIRNQIIGGNFTPTDESGDMYKFTVGLATCAAANGVDFQFNTTITRLLADSRHTKITGVEVIDSAGYYQTLAADAFIVALGCFSTPLLNPLGIKLLLYPGKGYSATYTIVQPEISPSVSVIDDSHKIVVSRLHNRLRIAGTCELNGYTQDLNRIRCEALTRRMRALFPDSCDYDHPTYWTGLRPMTPSNVPYIGQTKFNNLFLNTGHGFLGATMACGAGCAIADIISGRRPEVDFNFMGLK